jgi:hypothetical protein
VQVRVHELPLAIRTSVLAIGLPESSLSNFQPDFSHQAAFLIRMALFWAF